ncbi:ABC transporter ATP-binding protein [Butyrivibrio sp. AE2032]|uniref:ABC transporter ATP-binding protein n=1 Tax=Butyrivibrio sp. AE2032 TaxID=1458463 RepID=UPI000A926230|nr:ABC transporter ATP-binding protein [Butyrivibrio sp. AE2032]
MSNKPNAPKKPVEAAPAPGGRGRGPASMSQIMGSMDSLKRVLKMYIKQFPVLSVIVAICVIYNAVAGSMPAVFLQKVTAVLTETVETGDWQTAKIKIVSFLIPLIIIYALAAIVSILQSQLQAYMTQKFLHKLRTDLFDKMQTLPLRYFDTHKHGYIMSHYTNDIDTLRQLVSMAIPTILRAGAVIISLFIIMINYSLWMTLIMVLGIIAMIFATGKVGAGSAKYFVRQQKAVAATEGYIQEIMNGQKVVKVFNHEQKVSEEFNRLNNGLADDSGKANTYANILAPIIGNIGNIVYVLLAVGGGLMMVFGVTNISISGLPMGIDVIVPFLNGSKQFMGNINQFTMQMNAIVMAGAGAERVFALLDEEPETDDGYVTLVNADIAADGTITEADHPTGRWAWKHPHKAEGTITYTELKGDVTLNEVDFAYVPEKQVLYDVSVFAKPGQKVAFVGATGAGKTTITNLINRFYDIADGKIRYDGINVNKIKKKDLRRSLGLVLQETNLFTGTVMENIRYGRLDATDEECKDAAKLAGAADFIERLPDGYNTMLTNNGANFSQGQRQLLAIARAAVANPPVMILDEATSSIDTRTEAIVQRGMDKLMEGRTVFVIAHRLSTVMNSDVIMVLDHGRIIERGSHEQLIAEKGTYYQLYTGAFELE